MHYELGDHEWAAIKPMLPNKPRGVLGDRPHVLNASFGSCDLAHRGAICHEVSVRTPPATTASFGGAALVSGVGSWRHSPALMMRLSK